MFGVCVVPQILLNMHSMPPLLGGWGCSTEINKALCLGGFYILEKEQRGNRQGNAP